MAGGEELLACLCSQQAGLQGPQAVYALYEDKILWDILLSWRCHKDSWKGSCGQVWVQSWAMAREMARARAMALAMVVLGSEV